MRGLCFNCGSSKHWATACPQPLSGASHKCNSCSGKIVVSSRGQSELLSDRVGKEDMQPLPPKQLVPQKRAMPDSSRNTEPLSKAPRVVAPIARKGVLVSVCDKPYSTLSWFLGKSNPSPSICAKVRRHCLRSALELDNGDARTLALQGFAKAPPARAPQLLPGRSYLPSEWCPTACKSVRDGGPVRIRKAEEPSYLKGNQLLWSLPDLEKCCA